jgi:hypothetical protein
MYQLDAAKYHEAVVILQQVIALAHMGHSISHTAVMEAANRDSTDQMLDKFAMTIDTLEVPVTKLTVRDLQSVLKNDPSLKFFSCGQLLVNLSETLRRELQSVMVFSLDASRASFYEAKKPLFGSAVDKQFPSVAYEIDQAGKCYACDLTTASVFHSIRSMEAGIRAMARCLGIPDPTKGKDRNWSNVSRSINAEMEKRWPASTGRMSGDGQIFDKLYGAISGMQNPYRNETMHLDAKYTASEALHIFELVKGLMQKIASRMDENGDPNV